MGNPRIKEFLILNLLSNVMPGASFCITSLNHRDIYMNLVINLITNINIGIIKLTGEHPMF